jgi:Pvc16 N-terminal domain
VYQALSATSKTLKLFLEDKLDGLIGGTKIVSLNNPQQMAENHLTGLSVWLYRIVRDDQTLNAAAERPSRNKVKRTCLPFRFHYLIAPILKTKGDGAETEQQILGKVIQSLHDTPILRGGDLKGDLEGKNLELYLRMEPLTLEEITKIWDALDASYQLCVSYEVSVVCIESTVEEEIAEVEVVVPRYGVIVSSEEM